MKNFELLKSWMAFDAEPFANFERCSPIGEEESERWMSDARVVDGNVLVVAVDECGDELFIRCLAGSGHLVYKITLNLNDVPWLVIEGALNGALKALVK